MSEAELECCEDVEIHQDRLKIVSDQMPEKRNYMICRTVQGFWGFYKNKNSVRAV